MSKIEIRLENFDLAREYLSKGLCLMMFDEILEVITPKGLYSDHAFFKQSTEKSLENYKRSMEEWEEDSYGEWEVITTEEATKYILENMFHEEVV